MSDEKCGGGPQKAKTEKRKKKGGSLNRPLTSNKKTTLTTEK